MLFGMTGFGRATGKGRLGEWSIEITSVNRRHLEIQPLLPSTLHSLLVDLRSWIASRVGRGQLKVQLSYEPSSEVRRSIRVEEATIREIGEAADRMASIGKIDREAAFGLIWSSCEPSPLAVGALLGGDLDPLREAIRPTVEAALEALIAMKRCEGESIEQEIAEAVEQLEGEISAIEMLAPEVVERHREQLATMIAGVANEELMARELLLFANKVDIAEELSRFRLHLGQLTRIGGGKEGDFLLQELLREVNTLGSKASNGQITQHVVTIKRLLDRLREQMQNVE
jgi:uncharacterized protein (TIGR00255 family)